MRTRLRWQIPVLASASLLAGCIGSGPVRPPLEQQAEDLNRRGLEQFAQGETSRAVDSFRQALLIEQSVENEDGMAVNWLNLSLAYQRLGQMPLAEAALDAVLLDRLRTFPPARLAELALRKSTLATARKDWTEATFWLDESVRHCPGRCAIAARQHNLRAHHALARGEPDAALTAALAARRASRKDEAELANALRLAGAAHLALEDRAAASDALHAALEIDKRLRRSDKIHDDLRLLARASADPAQAETYRQRAHDVARARAPAAPDPDATRKQP